MERPPAGSYWIAPEMTSPRMTTPFGYIILEPSEDRWRGMVAAKTTKRYTTRDQFDWPVYHKKGERALLRLEDFGSRLLPGDTETHHWLLRQQQEEPILDIGPNNEVSFVLKETRIAIGGLLRCCTGTLEDHIRDHADESAATGSLVYCKYEKNDPTSMILGEDGIWRWNHP